MENDFFEKYARHYKLSTQSRDRLPADIEKLHRDRVPKCLKDIPHSARILDLGCAQGHLLAALERVGYFQLSGVDISSNLVEEARLLVTDKVNLLVANIQTFLGEQSDSSYDIIFFHDVLEHLPREITVAILSQIRRVLETGGILSLRVPNMASLLASYNTYIDFTHVTQFTEFALLQVLEQAGFDPAEIQHECQAPVLFWSWRKPHSAAFRLLNRGRWHLNNMLHKLAYKLSDVFPMPSIFDFNLLVVARK